MKLLNKVVIVTGGSRGIGKSIAKSLTKEGAKVFITFKKNFEEAEKVKNDIQKSGGECIIYQMKVEERISVKKAFKFCFQHYGSIDILVNNAGINKPTDFDQITDEDWDNILNVNLKGPFICSQEVIDFMKKNESSSIINIGSVSGQYGGPRTAHYASSKAGLISLSQVIARYSAKYNIRCNTIAAGLINSEMASAGLSSSVVQKAAENVILKKLGDPEDVAKAVIFLASNDSSYITAQTINVNGGLYF